MDFAVEISAAAAQDLEQLVRFLAQRNPPAAEHFGHALLDRILSLATLPERGARLAARPVYRRLIHPPWVMILYQVDRRQKRVLVARLWDARQDPDRLLLT